MTTLTKQLRKIKKQLPEKSLSTARACDWEDVRLVLKNLHKAKRRIRVYSDAGFVPNSYKWRCDIQYVEANKAPDGKWHIFTGWTGAQRRQGSGSLFVIQ